jgi:hypothetical protein
MTQQETQEQSTRDVVQLVEAIDRLVATIETTTGAPEGVKRLRVFHSTNSRKITWRCYDPL